MAAVVDGYLTMADWLKRQDPNGGVAQFGNALARTNQMLIDAWHKESNQAWSEQVTHVTKHPTVGVRGFNQGSKSSKGETRQDVEGLFILEGRSVVDRLLARSRGDVAAFRRSEAKLFVEAMNQEWMRIQLYGKKTTDGEINGFMTRMASGAAGVGNASQVLNAGGTTADKQTSILLVGWGDDKVYCPYPKGQPMGLMQEDLGEETQHNWDNIPGNQMQALVELFTWLSGLAFGDWRYAGRVANVEVADLTGLTNNQAPTSFLNIVHKMIELAYKIPNLEDCSPAYYVNRPVHTALTRIGYEKSHQAVTIEKGLGQFGHPSHYTALLGIPIRLCDSISLTEAVVPF